MPAVLESAKITAAGELTAGELTVGEQKCPAAGTLNQAPLAPTRKTIPLTSLAAVGITGFCAFLNLYATQPLLPSLMTHFNATAAEVSQTVSATSLGVALAAPFTGIFADSVGRKRVIVPAMLLIAVPTFIASLSGSLPELVFWRFIQGLVLPAIFAISMAYVSEEWADFGIGSAMTFYVTGNVLGGFAGRLVSGLAASYHGWQFSFTLLACIDLVCAAIALFLLPRSSKFKASKRQHSVGHLLFSQMRSKELMGSFLVGMNILFTLVAIFTYVTFHLSSKQFALDLKALSWLFAVYLVGATITPHTGKIIDRVGFHKTFIGAAMVSILGNFVTLIPTVPTVILGLAISSAALFVCQSATTTSLRKFAVTGASSAAGLYVCFYYVGGSLGGFLPGLFWSHGGWPMCVALISGLQLATIVLSLKMWNFPHFAPASSSTASASVAG